MSNLGVVQLKLDFVDKAANVSYWNKRAALYAELSEVQAWQLHLDEVMLRPNAPAREVEYVERRLSIALSGSLQ